MQFYHFIRVTKHHYLEYVLTKAIDLILNKDFESCHILLQPFERLKPLILLMTWDKFENDIDSRKKLIKLLWLDITEHQKSKVFIFFLIIFILFSVLIYKQQMIEVKKNKFNEYILCIDYR
jgi:hypothetical protein